MKLGINSHPLNHWTVEELPGLADELAALGVHSVRFPVWRQEGSVKVYTTFVEQLQIRGIEPLVVFDRNSFQSFAPPGIRSGLQYWKRYLPAISRVQMGNEPDQPDSPSSWYVPKRTFYRYLQIAQDVFPDAEIIAGGLVHVDFSYLDGLPEGVVPAIHPYAQDQESVGTLFAEVRNHTDRPFICTEFGSDAGNDGLRAEWLSQFVVALWKEHIDEAWLYCFSKRQDEGFGIVDHEGWPTETYAAYQAAIPAVVGEPPEDVGVQGWESYPWTPEEIAECTGCLPRTAAAIERNWPDIVSALLAVGQGSTASQAAVAATVAIETASTFEPVREAFWLSEEWRRNNLRYYPYYGRGYVQLTWDYNYRLYGERIGVDLLGNPDAALDPHISARVLAEYWQQRDIQASADAHDWRSVRMQVLGGTDGLTRLAASCEALLAKL